ncbi:MAG TPA: hypothetical protein VMT46_07545 [Anaerolineaceae bacterium]|nr:hypothetical protein [Anaerolineaceae bacterium]
MASPASDFLLENRLDALHKDLQRICILLEDEDAHLDAALIEAFGQPVGEHIEGILAYRQKLAQGGNAATQWDGFNALAGGVQGEIGAQLEMLAGWGIRHWAGPGAAGLEEGFSTQAEAWLRQIGQAADLKNTWFALPGRGPLVEPGRAFLRLSFLDWDLWHLPLLARAVGFLAALDSPFYRDKVSKFIEPVLGQVDGLLIRPASDPLPDLARLVPQAQILRESFSKIATEEGRASFRAENQSLLGQIRRDQETFLHALFADMLATALAGPMYAAAVFVLELDYRTPEVFSLDDPDQIEKREIGPRRFPAPVHRAAAILTTLQFIEEEEEGPFLLYSQKKNVREGLESLWRETLLSVRQVNRLEQFRTTFSPWFAAVYQEILRDRLLSRLGTLIADWREAEAWRGAFAGSAPPYSTRPSPVILACAMWLHALDYPAQFENLLKMVTANVPNQYTTLKGARASLPEVVALARLYQFKTRWARLYAILNSERIPAADRAAVSGRFFRLLSEVWLLVETEIDRIKAAGVIQGSWGNIEKIGGLGRSLQREAQDFLGGVWISRQSLDHESEKLSGAVRGPHISRLATHILREYSRKTGVNWSARTVLGRDPFLETSTDVVRTRFPDWSVWNLPLMAHEFGHQAALASPEFLRYKGLETQSLAPDDRRRQHLDELFADIFACYTFGPAFGLDAILLHFNPREAFLARGSHPTDNERVKVILAVYRRMNDQARGETVIYDQVLDDLKAIWNNAVEECQEAPAAVDAARISDVERWTRGLLHIIDASFRLGARYKPANGELAVALAEKLNPPTIALTQAEILDQAAEIGIPIRLLDILNGLWLARFRLEEREKLVDLSQIANSICLDWEQQLVKD